MDYASKVYHSRFQKVAELSQGNIFGELALLHKNARRSASIISKGTVELIRLDGTDYSEVCKCM